MSEFKLTGDFYVSEWNGNSLNAGTDISPFAHPSDVPDQVIAVLGSGYYLGAWSSHIHIHGDGLTIVDLNGGDFKGIQSSNFKSSLGSPVLKNIVLKRCNEFFKDVYQYQNSGLNNFIVDSYLETDFINSQYRTGLQFYNCILKSYQNNTIGRNYLGSQNDKYLFSNCIFSSSLSVPSVRFTNEYRFCFFGNGNNLIIDQVGEIISNCCINSRIIYFGVEYELKLLYNGSPRPNANPSIPDFITIDSNIYTNGNFATVDPKIIDLENKICEPDSDLLKAANSYGYIGGFRAGKAIKKGDSNPDLTITTSQIDTSNPSNWTIGSGYDEGYIFITFKLSDNLVQVPNIHMDALLAFDSSEAGGSVGNNNVPDFFPTLYTPLSQAGLKPNRLTYGLRTSQRIAEPTSESHWDNDNIALGSDVAKYYVQEWGDQPKIYDVLGVTYGGGNPESISASGNAINARWCQVQIRLTNRRTQ